jgi:hypothetical protein
MGPPFLQPAHAMRASSDHVSYCDILPTAVTNSCIEHERVGCQHHQGRVADHWEAVLDTPTASPVGDPGAFKLFKFLPRVGDFKGRLVISPGSRQRD